MKTLVLVVCCSLIFFKTIAQSKDDKWNIGAHGGITQYNGDLGQGWYNVNHAFYGFGGISVSRYLFKRFDVSALFTMGQVGYTGPYDVANANGFRVTIITANVYLRYYLNSRESVFGPYVFLGGSVLNQQSMDNDFPKHKKKVDLALPTGGIGFNIRFGPYLSLQVQEMFLYTWTDDLDHKIGGANDAYLYHTLGLTYNFGKKAKYAMPGTRQ